MSTAGFRALPDPEDFPLVEGEPTPDVTSLLNENHEEALTVESDVTAEDLSSEDLLNNGALPEDLELDQSGIRQLDADRSDPATRDTIDDRVRQEVPEESFDVVPSDGGGPDTDELPVS